MNPILLGIFEKILDDLPSFIQWLVDNHKEKLKEALEKHDLNK